MGATVQWTAPLEAIGADGKTSDLTELMTVARDLDRPDGSVFGLSERAAIREQILARITPRQVDRAVKKERPRSGCGAQRAIHDRRLRKARIYFRKVTIKAAQFDARQYKMGQQRNEIGSEVERFFPVRMQREA